jgi:hypothetical protein
MPWALRVNQGAPLCWGAERAIRAIKKIEPITSAYEPLLDVESTSCRC